jgi:NADH-quinone oxidoreductase subunit L
MLIGTFALVGFPMTAGFFSKDAIIEAAFASHRTGALYAYILATASVGLTSFYSFRLTFMTFYGEQRWHPAHTDDHGIAAHEGHKAHLEPTNDSHAPPDHAPAHADDAHARGHDLHAHALDPHESPRPMLIPLYVLSVGALLAGLAFSSHFIGDAQSEFWKGSIYYGANNHILHDMEEVPVAVKWLPMLLLGGGFLVALYGYVLNPAAPAGWARANPLLYKFLLNKWYFDELYDLIFVKPAFWIGRLLWRQGDMGTIDRYGPDGLSASVVILTRQAVKLQSGYIYHYAFAMLIGVTVIITWYLVGGVR